MRCAIKNDYAALEFVQRYKHTYSRIIEDIPELRHTNLRGSAKVLSCIEDQKSACKKHDDTMMIVTIMLILMLTVMMTITVMVMMMMMMMTIRLIPHLLRQ